MASISIFAPFPRAVTSLYWGRIDVMNEVSERWLPVPGYEGLYEVSDQGRVRSLDRIVVMKNGRRRPTPGKILKPEFRRNTGYHGVALSKDGISRTHYVHRLVLMAFRGLPGPGQEGCHGNDIRTDNRLENLRWDTHHANVHDCIDRGRHREIGHYNRDKTECDRGHPFNEANTKIRPEGRACRECERMMERARYHKAKAKQGKTSRAFKALPDTEVA